MIAYLLTLFFCLQSPEIPFRQKDDFKIELKYHLKQRPVRDATSVVFDAVKAEDKRGPAELPYLIVHITILNHKTEEVRFKCENNYGEALFNKKAEKSLRYAIDMGYIDDLKDHVSAHVFTLYALTEKKAALNRIELLVQEDGTFLVNGEKRGKF